MFVCENCSKISKPQEKSYQFPLKYSEKSYPYRAKVNKLKKGGKIKETDDPGGFGHEIEKEITVCKTCFKQLSQS